MDLSNAIINLGFNSIKTCFSSKVIKITNLQIDFFVWGAVLVVLAFVHVCVLKMTYQFQIAKLLQHITHFWWGFDAHTKIHINVLRWCYIKICFLRSVTNIPFTLDLDLDAAQSDSYQTEDITYWKKEEHFTIKMFLKCICRFQCKQKTQLENKYICWYSLILGEREKKFRIDSKREKGKFCV